MDLLKLSKPVAVVLAIGILFALGGLGFWRGTARLDSMQDKAVAVAVAGRDAHWKAELEKSNRLASEATAAGAVRAAQAEAREAIAQLAAKDAEHQLETLNASLPNPGACSLDRDRWRLLNPAQ